ncbi:MAG: RsmD family RNA methyltransferase [Verrucomicrobia bacterium]|nr:RsmD family RNA methyltransferase [Verrucomicrobiota bacterium]
MRVIAGSAGGLSLQPPDKNTRPTMDRVRGAIFSSLGERVPEARVLDLFAGSGALGIEALSRGAASATFVEHLGPTTGVIRKNLQSTRLDRLPTTVQQMDAFRFLDLYVEEEGFDLIFADPPYLKDTRPSVGDVTNLADNLLSHPNMPKALGVEGLLILECERRQPLPSLTPSTSLIPWEILSDRNYGESRILILRRAS